MIAARVAEPCAKIVAEYYAISLESFAKVVIERVFWGPTRKKYHCVHEDWTSCTDCTFYDNLYNRNFISTAWGRGTMNFYVTPNSTHNIRSWSAFYWHFRYVEACTVEPYRVSGRAESYAELLNVYVKGFEESPRMSVWRDHLLLLRDGRPGKRHAVLEGENLLDPAYGHRKKNYKFRSEKNNDSLMFFALRAASCATYTQMFVYDILAVASMSAVRADELVAACTAREAIGRAPPAEVAHQNAQITPATFLFKAPFVSLERPRVAASNVVDDDGLEWLQGDVHCEGFHLFSRLSR